MENALGKCSGKMEWEEFKDGLYTYSLKLCRKHSVDLLLGGPGLRKKFEIAPIDPKLYRIEE